MRPSFSVSRLLSPLAGCVASSQLTQLPAVSVALGHTARIICQGNSIGDSDTNWYQYAGQVPANLWRQQAALSDS